jgi:hypothetical protein
MIFYWTAILAISTLLYVLFDGLDLGVGIISGGAGSHPRRDAMMNAIAPIWDGNVHGAAIGGPAPRAKPCNRAIRSAISSRGKSTSREALLPWLSGALSRHRSPLARWRAPCISTSLRYFDTASRWEPVRDWLCRLRMAHRPARAPNF